MGYRFLSAFSASGMTALRNDLSFSFSVNFLLAIIVTNPFVFPRDAEPELKIRTEIIFELGKEGILFSSIESVCEDAQQNVYVLDRMASKIYKFSPDGKLLLSFGSKGQGPGEFLRAKGIRIGFDEKSIVDHNAGYSYFSKDY